MRRLQKFFMFVLCGFLLSLSSVNTYAEVDPSIVPDYVKKGLDEYKINGYGAAVSAWLADSPYSNATTMASNIAFFRNIEKLAGTYVSYDILMTKETISSNVVYVRMNFERVPGYILFTSLKRGNMWVLGRIQLDRMQRFGSSK